MGANAFILNGTILPELVYILIKIEVETIHPFLHFRIETKRMQQFLAFAFGNVDVK